MVPELRSFVTNDPPTLRVYFPGPNTVVTSFEDYLPASETVRENFGLRPDLPASLCWLKDNHEYYAYLPKDHPYNGHLLAPLNHHRLELVERDGRWFVDDETRNLWRSLDVNLTYTVSVIRGDLLTELDHHEPSEAIKYGFAHGHRNLRGLQVALRVSRNAFVHRLAYLAYLISRRYQWHQPLVDQPWWKDFRARCTATWVDSVWDAIYQQWSARNFAGVVVGRVSSSVRWLKPALAFGVPIWVWNPQSRCFDGLDGGFVIGQWRPTNEQITEIREVEKAKHSANPPPGPSAQPHPPSTAVLENARWYKSWEDFFQRRDEGDALRLREARKDQKATWEAKTREAQGFNQPGKRGARVFVWESCGSGGFYRTLQSRFEVERDWDFYLEEALVFNAQDDVWDYCPFMWEPAIRDGPPDGPDDDEDDIMEHWYIKPGEPAPLHTPSVVDFLHSRYGFLLDEPHPTPTTVLPLDKATAYRIVGLPPETAEAPPRYLQNFLRSILAGCIPAGHCDLCPDSPPDEIFPRSRKTLIYDTVFLWHSLELSEGTVFALTNTSGDSQILLAVHEPLSVLQLVRDGTPLNLHDALRHLIRNGSRFTPLYPTTRPLTLPRFNILPFPVRDVGWRPKTEEFQAYMSRLKTLFLERPYVLAAAFSRGGIAWRVAQEVLGTEGSITTVLDTYPDQTASVRTNQGTHWFHQLDEGEWFYLVGGYEVLTGSWVSFWRTGLHSPWSRKG